MFPKHAASFKADPIYDKTKSSEKSSMPEMSFWNLGSLIREVKWEIIT